MRHRTCSSRGAIFCSPRSSRCSPSEKRGAGGEIQLTDAMQVLIRSQNFTGVKYQGRVFDCGSKIGFLTANVIFALDRPDLADDFRRELQAALGSL